MKAYTTKEVAKMLGVSERRVRQIAKSRKVGAQLSDGTWIFLPNDIKKLEHHAPGRPSSTETSELTKESFESLLATAGQPRESSQPPDSEEKGKSEGHLSGDCNESRTHQDNEQGT